MRTVAALVCQPSVLVMVKLLLRSAANPSEVMTESRGANERVAIQSAVAERRSRPSQTIHSRRFLNNLHVFWLRCAYVATLPTRSTPNQRPHCRLLSLSSVSSRKPDHSLQSLRCVSGLVVRVLSPLSHFIQRWGYITTSGKPWGGLTQCSHSPTLFCVV